MSLSGLLGEFSLADVVTAVGTLSGRLRFSNLSGGMRIELDLVGGQIRACRYGPEDKRISTPEDIFEKLCIVATSDVGSFVFRKQAEEALESDCRMPLHPTLLEVLSKCDELRSNSARYLPADLKLLWSEDCPLTSHGEFAYLLSQSAAYFRNGASAKDIAEKLVIAPLAAQNFCSTLAAEGYLRPFSEVPIGPVETSQLRAAIAANDPTLEVLHLSRWFYLNGKEEVGPVPGTEILDAIAAGKLSASVPVWRRDLSRWAPFEEVWLRDRRDKVEAEKRPSHTEVTYGDCFVCKELYRVDEMLYYQGWHVCHGCRETFFQKLVQNPVGGFDPAPPLAPLWARFVAWVLDLVASSLLALSIFAMLTLLDVIPSLHLLDAVSTAIALLSGSLALHVAGMRIFGTTPGKWALDVAAVFAKNHKPLKSGRLFLRWLTGLVPLFHPLVFFDSEHRALHDLAARSLVVIPKRAPTAAKPRRAVRLSILGASLLLLAAACGNLYVTSYQRAMLDLSADSPAMENRVFSPFAESALSQRWQAFFDGDVQSVPIFALSQEEARLLLAKLSPLLAHADVRFLDRKALIRAAIPVRGVPGLSNTPGERVLNVEFVCSFISENTVHRLVIESVRCRSTGLNPLLLRGLNSATNTWLQREMKTRGGTLPRLARVESVPGALELRR